MPRRICCVVALLAAGTAESVQYTELAAARSNGKGEEKRFRFLSLAEAWAIALEKGRWTEFSPNLCPPIIAEGVADLVRRNGGEANADVRILTRLAPKAAGILITGIDAPVRRNELEQHLNHMMISVHNAYWNLYASYGDLYGREQGLRFAYETWKIVAAKCAKGEASLSDFTQVRRRYDLFLNQRLQALDAVRNDEGVLRDMLGMKIEDGTRLVPSDAPTLEEKQRDWQEALEEAKKRPELRKARADLDLAEWNYRMVKMVFLPVLRLFDAKECEAMDNWSPPLTFGRVGSMADFIPPGPHCVRQAGLQLAHAFETLRSEEMKVEVRLGIFYRRLPLACAQIKRARAQRDSFTTQLRDRFESFRAGKKDAPLGQLLEAQRSWADALACEFRAITTYNNYLANWEYGKGTILAHAHVMLAEKVPSDRAWVSATEHERKRTQRQVRREPGIVADSQLDVPVLPRSDPDQPPTQAPCLPALWKRFPPLRDAGNLLPDNEDAAKKEGEMVEPLSDWKASDIFVAR